MMKPLPRMLLHKILFRSHYRQKRKIENCALERFWLFWNIVWRWYLYEDCALYCVNLPKSGQVINLWKIMHLLHPWNLSFTTKRDAAWPRGCYPLGSFIPIAAKHALPALVMDTIRTHSEPTPPSSVPAARHGIAALGSGEGNEERGGRWDGGVREMFEGDVVKRRYQDLNRAEMEND